MQAATRRNRLNAGMRPRPPEPREPLLGCLGFIDGRPALAVVCRFLTAGLGVVSESRYATFGEFSEGFDDGPEMRCGEVSFDSGLVAVHLVKHKMTRFVAGFVQDEGVDAFFCPRLPNKDVEGVRKVSGFPGRVVASV